MLVVTHHHAEKTIHLVDGGQESGHSLTLKSGADEQGYWRAIGNGVLIAQSGPVNRAKSWMKRGAVNAAVNHVQLLV